MRTDLVIAEGQRLEAAWHGPPPQEAPTLVFLHEGLGCAAMWRDVPARLAADTGCGALVYSRQGYGRSEPVKLPRPLDYMQREGLTTLPAVLDATGVRQAILVGHSDGASIAIVHAGAVGRNISALDRVRGLILMAPHLFCEELSIQSIEQAKKEYLHGELRLRLQRHHGDNVDGAFWGWNGAWLDPRFRSFNIEEFLPTIRVPVLAIQGEADPYGTLRQIESLARSVAGPLERLILPGCGHAPHKERPEETRTKMIAFVRRVIDR